MSDGALRTRRPFWILAWIFAALCFALGLTIREPANHFEFLQIKNGLGLSLRVAVYMPRTLTARAPGAVICQPINDPPEYGRMLELELVRDGFVVLTFDWRGRAPGENRQLLRAHTQETLRADVAAAVAWLRTQPEVDPKRVVIAGHSVGGTLAIDAALADPTLAGVASIGMEADVTPDQPRNLLWTVGLYDEFRDPARMRGFLAESVGHAAPEGQTLGDLARGTARRLDVSPTADHFTELQDHRTHAQVLAWFRQVVGLAPSARAMTMEYRALLLMLGWFAMLVAGLATLRHYVSLRVNRVRWLRGVNAAAFLAFLAVGFLHGRLFLEQTDALLILFVFVLLSGFLTALDPESSARAGRTLLRVLVVLWASIILTLVINAVPEYFRNAQYLVYLPEFAVRHPLDWVDAYAFDYTRPLVFSTYGPDGVRVHLWVFVVMAIEVLFPAILLDSLVRLIRRGASVRRGEGKPVPVSSWVALAALAVFLAVVIWLRLEQGFLTGESARAAARFLLRYAVLPFFIFAFLWRLTRRRAVQAAARS